ncbi:ABC-type sugar transport system, periplasmic component [Bacteroidales bacterium Barb7]|nr:ABC-type sugar transport system, periplasmic component [Bacteroidales bacterium Barb7]
MNKKTQETQPANAKLIKSKEEFKKLLEDRIAKGQELLLIEVSFRYDDYYGRGKYEYDKSSKDSFFEQYKKWSKYNIEFLNASFDTVNNKYTEEYQYAGSSISSTRNENIIEEKKKKIKSKIIVLESLIERLDLISSAVENQIHGESKNKAEIIKTQTNRIFIVHGHNEVVKGKMALCLTKLGLKPIILHEQENSGKTIIEKIEKHSSGVGFAVILLTADDKGKNKNDSDYKNRARQNVVFEMGYFIAKLGRDRVFLLLEDDVEKPGDLDGIVYNVIDAKDSWRYDLVKELKAANYSVSADML